MRVPLGLKAWRLVMLLVLLFLLKGIKVRPAFTSSPPPNSEQLKQEAEEVLQINRVTQRRSCGGLTREVSYHAPYLCPIGDPPSGLPSLLHPFWRAWWKLAEPWRVRYPHQFFWDSCFQAIALSHINLDLAKKETKSLLWAQDENGFIPHLIWNPERMHWLDHLLKRVYPRGSGSPFLQPPMLAEAVGQVYLQSQDLGYLREVLPAVKKHYRYIERVRCRMRLPEIIISYESGKDQSPEYDPIYGESNAVPTWRGPMAKLIWHYWKLGWDLEKIFANNRFRVKDVLFCSIYARNLAKLSRLCEFVGDPDAEFFRGRALLVEKSVEKKMWDEEAGIFFSLDARRGKEKKIKVVTISSLMPLVLSNLSQDKVERLVEHLINPEEFWAPFPVPAIPLNSPIEEIGEHIIWRGRQTWMFTNWYLIKGLQEQARRWHDPRYEKIAKELIQTTTELVSRSGFREYYDARTGKGEGAKDFGPSAIVLDLLPAGEGESLALVPARGLY